MVFSDSRGLRLNNSFCMILNGISITIHNRNDNAYDVTKADTVLSYYKIEKSGKKEENFKISKNWVGKVTQNCNNYHSKIIGEKWMTHTTI